MDKNITHRLSEVERVKWIEEEGANEICELCSGFFCYEWASGMPSNV